MWLARSLEFVKFTWVFRPFALEDKKRELMAENGVDEECEARVRLCVTWIGRCVKSWEINFLLMLWVRKRGY